MSTLKKNIAWTTVLSGIGFFLSFTSQIVVSYFFGTSAELDAYWIAFALMNLLAFPIIPLKESLVPLVHKQFDSEVDYASLFFSRGMTLILLVATSSVVLALLDAKQLSQLMLGDVSDEIMQMVNTQLYWLIPGLWLLAISETLNALLTSFNKVILQMISRVIATVTTLIFIGAFSSFIGIYSLPLGFVSGQLAMSFLLIYAFSKLKISFKVSFPVGLGKEYYFLSLTLLVSALSTQFYLLYEKNIFSEFGAGIISSFQYGVAITNAIIAIFASSLANVFWPRFMAQIKKDNIDGLIWEFSMAIKLSLLALGGLCTFIYIYADPLVNIIFVRGAFNQEAALKTGEMLRAAIYTALPIAGITLLSRALISLKSAKTIMLIGLTIALSGCAILKLAQMIQSPIVAIHHWLFSNSIGFMISIIAFAMLTNMNMRIKISACWWALRFTLLLFFIIILNNFFKEYTFPVGSNLLDLITSAAFFFIIYVLFLWILKLYPLYKFWGSVSK